MLIRTFEQSLNRFWYVNIVGEEVLAVGVSYTSMASQLKSTYFGSYFVVVLLHQVFKQTQLWIGIF